MNIHLKNMCEEKMEYGELRLGYKRFFTLSSHLQIRVLYLGRDRDYFLTAFFRPLPGHIRPVMFGRSYSTSHIRPVTFGR